MRRRAFLLASTLAIPSILALSPRAEALTARLLTLDELVEHSTYVVIGTAGDQRSVWEDMPSGRRIVTYTHVVVERAIVGAPGAELWVRTLGGAVDKIGQAVPGEAQITPGSRSLLFLFQGKSAVVVTAMGQGHFPVVTDDKGTQRLASSPEVGMLVGRLGPVVTARDVLLGAAVEDAVATIQRTKKAQDEKK